MTARNCDACILNSPRPCDAHRPQQFIRNNIAYNSEDEMNLAAEIPGVYLDRWNDAGHVAEAILSSEWLAAHDREVAAKALEDARAEILKWHRPGDHITGHVERAHILRLIENRAAAIRAGDA